MRILAPGGVSDRPDSATRKSQNGERLTAYLEDARGALSGNTVRAVRADLERFGAWCAGRGLSPLPARAATVVAYVEAMASERAPATVRRYVSSVAAAHKAVGEHSPLERVTVRRALQRMHRRKGCRQAQVHGLTWALRQRLMEAAAGRVIDVRNRAILAVAYDAMLRRSELVALQVVDVTIERGGSASLLVRRAKTDPEGGGAMLYLHRDSVRLLSEWLSASGISGGPLFRSMRKDGTLGGRLHESQVPPAVTVALWSATSGTTPEPNVSVATLTHSTGTWAGDAVNTFNAPPDTELDAGTTYFVHMSYSGGGRTLTLRSTNSTSADAGGAADWSVGRKVRSIQGGNWVASSGPPRFRINGRASEVTPPLLPRVTSVMVASAPQSGDTYRSYETILFTVTFSEPVRVTPGRLRLKVGLDNPGGASGSTVEAVFSGLSQSQRPTADTPQARLARHMHFKYKVQLFDRDEDGVRIGANALRLASGARIRNEVGSDAELDHVALGPQSDHKVDGRADVPMIERIEVVSTPRLSSKGTTNRDTYGEGENIRIEVRFDQPVVVEGEPTFALEVGNPCRAVCEADYASGSGTNTLVFAYLVLEVDIDRNGIAIRGNPIEVVSGDRIRNAADQEAHLSSKGKGTQRGHKVDGSRAAGSHLSVEDAEAHEADGEMEFTVRLEPHGLGIVTVDYATADGSGDRGAVAGEDYTETSGTLRFNSLETERTVSVPITDDAHEDDGETFTLTLSNPDGAKLRSGEGEATGTIHNSEIQPLTATFEDMPETHDGESAFTFRVALSEDIGISFRALREDAFTVTGGRVTRGTRVDDRRDLFEMTVEPDSGGDVTIELAAGRECATSGAICTKGENRRQLTNSPSVTVAGPAGGSGPPELTASFEGMPAKHRGEGGFHFRVAFSEDIGISFRALREDAFTVTGGRVTGGSRVDGRRDLFKMTVRPDSDGDVTIELAAGRECATSGAICTKGENRRQLTNSPSVTVAGPAGGSGPPELTASFEGMPAKHRGEGGFHFRVAFSEDIGISFRALREDAFTVTGGRVTGGSRVDGRRDLFKMTVRPDSDGDVTITLPAGRECATSGAICTKGENRRQLTNSPSATVKGPAASSAAAAPGWPDRAARLCSAAAAGDGLTPSSAAAALWGDRDPGKDRLDALDSLGNGNGGYDLGDMLAWAARCRGGEASGPAAGSGPPSPPPALPASGPAGGASRRRKGARGPARHRRTVPDPPATGSRTRRSGWLRTALLAVVISVWGCGDGIVDPRNDAPRYDVANASVVDPGPLHVRLTAPPQARDIGAMLVVEGPAIDSLQAPGLEMFETDESSSTRREVVIAGALPPDGPVLRVWVPHRGDHARYRVRLLQVAAEDFTLGDLSVYGSVISR